MTPGPGAAGPGLLRQFLREVERAAPGEGLPEIAARLGVAAAEAEALAGYWVRKGRLRRTALGVPDCGGCPLAARSCAPAERGGSCRAGAGPHLVALTPAANPAAPGAGGGESGTRTP
ncbi:FeoC-like transcriptional regulator [Streptomyces sp. NPDC048507]|uniref:FeoC-like transcriptional regulator n=1 Tax=Streptomyces sp. NPDC048507 TaxID=3365560 RepID=UPI003723FA00